MRQATLVIAMAGLLAGCTGQPVKDLTPLFNERDFAWSMVEGAGVIKGQAFARTMGGEVRHCAGVEIVLVPAAPYTDAYNVALAEGYRAFTPHPEAYRKYRRTTLGDATGSFEFDKLSAGLWYVQCNLTWYIPGPYGLKETGATLEKKVKLEAGQVARIVVTAEPLGSPSAAAAAPPAKPNFPAPKGLDCRLWC